MPKNKYETYDEGDIDIMLKEPWEVSDRPYMLHAAYALCALHDLFASDDDEEPMSPEDIWGCRIERKILDHLVIDIAEDFNDAASNRKPIKIWGKTYSIRKVNAYDHKRLHLIFDFPIEKGEYIINKEGILNLAGPTFECLKPYEVKKDSAQRNRTYLRQIIRLAEDDENDGWDKLTDMEIVLYCWAMYYNRYQDDNFLHFKQTYKDYLYIKEKEILECLNEKSSLRQLPIGMYAFSYEKVNEWNIHNRQESEAAKIPPEEADNHWYETALKTTFKPIDLR